MQIPTPQGGHWERGVGRQGGRRSEDVKVYVRFKIASNDLIYSILNAILRRLPPLIHAYDCSLSSSMIWLMLNAILSNYLNDLNVILLNLNVI